MKDLKEILKKYQKHFLIGLILVLVLVLGYFPPWQTYWQEIKFKIQTRGIDKSCVQIEGHQLVGYYDCNPIKKGETSMLKFKTREETFVEKISGLPGDELEFVGENLKLNSQILKNSSGEPYLFDERAQKLITIPLENGKIPEGRYLVLSEEKGPSAFDSRWYGFVEKEHLQGRVIY